jgi:hypothetical protein
MILGQLFISVYLSIYVIFRIINVKNLKLLVCVVCVHLFFPCLNFAPFCVHK